MTKHVQCSQCKQFNQDLQRMTVRLADLEAVNLIDTNQWVRPTSKHRIVKRYEAYIEALETNLDQHCGVDIHV